LLLLLKYYEYMNNIDSDQGLLSLYEFIYSCRDSYNSTYPNPQDESFINSIKMLKKIKNEVASSKYFFI